MPFFVKRPKVLPTVEMVSRKQNPMTKAACGFGFLYIHPQLHLDNDVFWRRRGRAGRDVCF